VRNCKIHEGPDGLPINTETGQPFTYKDECVAHGPHLGYDPAAAEASKKSVKAFLKAVFKLE
jgi:dienelactone hydrolase